MPKYHQYGCHWYGMGAIGTPKRGDMVDRSPTTSGQLPSTTTRYGSSYRKLGIGCVLTFTFPALRFGILPGTMLRELFMLPTLCITT